MDKREFLAVSICVALFLSGCQNQTPVENEWSELWGNSSGNILGNGYVATDAETICYTDLNNTNDFLYKLNETGEPILLAYCLLVENCSDVNIIGNSVVFRIITKGKGVEAGYYIIEQDGSDLRLFDGYTILESCQNR